MAAQAGPARALEKTAAELPAAGAGTPPAQAGHDAAAGRSEPEARWKSVFELSCELLVGLPVPNFTVADLLQLRAGSIIDARWRAGHDVPLRLNGTLIAWSELEVLGDRLAVRLTELA
jgi:flagellar motor switch/type III secretory pathway protein FliN